jgi:tRNA(fMet)-specific endonuclease VapC
VFALDTNILIYALKGTGQVGERLRQLDPQEVGVPAIVAYELEFGTISSASPSKRRLELHRLLSVITILPFDRQSGIRAARLRMDLEKAGTSIGPFDTLIAGTVLAYGATLVTHNVREFSRIPGLQIEDWYIG